MHAITHPSQPNYIHFFSGESNGCIDNGPITPYADPANGIPYQPLTTPNLVRSYWPLEKLSPHSQRDCLPWMGQVHHYFRCRHVLSR